MSVICDVETDCLAAIVGSSDDAIISQTLTGTITSWNSAAAGLYGYQAEEIVGRHISVLFSPDSFSEENRIIERVSRGERIEHFETRRRHKDGHNIPVSLTVSPIRDSTGKIIGVSKIARDITERNRTAEEALLRSEDRLRRVIEAAPNALVTIRANGQIEMVNAQAERMFGYPREELLGQPAEMLVPDHHPNLRNSFFSSPRSPPMGAGRDLFGLRKDGSEFPVEIGLNPIETDEGTMVLSAIVDISAQKRLEEQFRRFRRVVESAPNAMVMINANGRIEMVNAQAERVFGYSREELLNQPVEMLVPKRFWQHHPDLRDSYFADPRSRPLGAGRDLYGLRKDGSEFPVEIGLNPIETDEGTMVLSAIIDISARKRLEEQFRRFRRVVESAPNAMVMINVAGGIEMVNAQAQHVFGYTREELLGQPVEMLVPERFRRHDPGLRASFFGDPRSRPMGAGRDLYGLRKDGSEFPVEIGLNPIETDEGPMVLSAIVDISDRKQREESIQAALKEKDILLGEIHHRVKNNLQVIYSLLDMQSSKVGDETALQLLRESQNRIRSMSLIHQRLYESKDFGRVDFRSFLDALVPTLVSSYSADPSRITLLIDAAEVSLPINAAIPCGLIVNELISNALKHAFPGRRHGEIRIGLAKGRNDRVELSVSDNGVGIPEGLDVANATSLGLQLVALLADQLAGEIVIQRANPTRFVLHLAVRQ
jgi:PAS domain S-box-containing protein